jgi:sugar phosphate isomerase/epimerase
MINTLIFLEELQQGTMQSALLSEVKSYGAVGVDIREEFVPKDPTARATELQAIAENAKKEGLSVCFSIPDAMILDGAINPKLAGYFADAATLGAKRLKMSNCHFVENDSLETLKAMIEKATFVTTIENDQSADNGTLAAVVNSFALLDANQVKMGFTFDVGNWNFVEQDALEAANVLKTRTTDIHMKNAKNHAGTLINDGVFDWKAILKTLPNTAPCFVEYPLTKAQRPVEIALINAEL